MSSSEDFIFFGTPLEELDPDEIPRKKYQPDLTVRDAQGRRRFHGAFTGGFSAGFYNTVGTKEGWAPSSFKSSKANRAQGVTMRPEDYMDEEDVGEFGIAPKKIQVKEDFADFSEKKKRTRDPTRGHDRPIPGSPPLKILFRPTNETIGLKLLSQMGWKPGQGIGPRLTKKDKKHREKQSHKVYGCSLPPGLGGTLSSSSEDDEYAEGFTFAPSDTADVNYEAKNNQHGIGYVSLDAHSVLSAPVDMDRPTTAKAHLEKGRRKLAITGQAFGVGAFEDDDADIYAREDLSQYNFFLSEELPSSTAGETALSKQAGGRQSGVHQMTKALEGFHLAKEAPAQRRVYPPPQIPPDFEPIHRTAKRERRRFEEPRANLYKEEKTEHKGSVFDLLSPEDRARLESAKQGRGSVCEKSSTSAEPSESDADRKMESTTVARTLPSVSQARLASLEPLVRPAEVNKPFAKNEAKQKRFEQYLALLNSNRAELYPAMQPLMMTEWEKEKERKEFEQAAVICQPSKSLGLRFVSKNMLADDDVAVDVPIDCVEENDDKAKAAELGMFGKLTHEEFEWHPADLLCKRFNVPNPYPGCEMVGVATVKIDKRSIFNFLNVPEGQTQEDKASQLASSDPGGDSKLDVPGTSLAELFSRKVEEPTPDTEDEDDNTGETREEQRPPLSFFKAIFSEESSLDEEEGSSASVGVLVPTGSTVQSYVPEPAEIGVAAEKKQVAEFEQTKQTLTRPARGVFANLDFDRLNALPPAMPVEELQRMAQPVTSSTERQAENEKVEEKVQENKSDLYGPCLPPPGMVLQHTHGSAKAHHKHKKEHHKSGKEKHKKQKSKAKRKKKHNKKVSVKSRPAHSSNSSDSEADSERSSEAEDEPSCKDIISKEGFLCSSNGGNFIGQGTTDDTLDIFNPFTDSVSVCSVLLPSMYPIN